MPPPSLFSAVQTPLPSPSFVDAPVFQPSNQTHPSLSLSLSPSLSHPFAILRLYAYTFLVSLAICQYFSTFFIPSAPSTSLLDGRDRFVKLPIFFLALRPRSRCAPARDRVLLFSRVLLAFIRDVSIVYPLVSARLSFGDGGSFVPVQSRFMDRGKSRDNYPGSSTSPWMSSCLGLSSLQVAWCDRNARHVERLLSTATRGGRRVASSSSSCFCFSISNSLWPSASPSREDTFEYPRKHANLRSTRSQWNPARTLFGTCSNVRLVDGAELENWNSTRECTDGNRRPIHESAVVPPILLHLPNEFNVLESR